jgi:S-DNA-T family DNA segregation ATPase FtsK/SpoIIIE
VKALQRADHAAYEADQLAQSHTDTTKSEAPPIETKSIDSKPSTTDSSVESGEVIGINKTELDKFVERLPEDPATPITVAYPTPSELEAAVKEVTSPPNYSAAQNFPWQLPNPEMLAIAKPGGITKQEIEYTSLKIEESLGQFGIDVSVDQVRQGPTVTMYGLSPGWKGRSEENTGQRVRVDTILNREKDIALALASPNLRFEAPVPGESVVGIEVPNAHPTAVTLHSVMHSAEWNRFKETAALPVPLGLGSGGDPVMADLSRMPHTLVAGSTGSGKSVCMNAIITGLILTKTPLDVRLIMIDPKRVELTPYQGIPHLYHPVIVESARAVIVLRSLVDEMMGRFRQLENAGVKNIASYNEKITEKMPYLVILVDELADLMLTGAGDVERLLVRLAQLGRATGVHLVIATQRPSVDVVTGLIKANFPSRISFAVMSQIDSRTILDSVGAEKLLGRGDMLYMPIDKPKPSRVQGAFLTDNEIEGIVSAWRDAKPPPLPELVVSFDESSVASGGISSPSNGDSLFEQAANLAHSQKTLSVSLLQRRLRIGYPRAARLMDELEDEGIVGAGEPGKPRPVL